MKGTVEDDQLRVRVTGSSINLDKRIPWNDQVVGLYTDRKPQPYSLMVGMGFTLVGLAMMSQATTYPVILLSAALIGMGSSVFHPEASRVARMAAGGRYGLAQSLFQVGGNMGSAAGPLLAAFIVVPRGQHSIVWFSGAALIAMTVLFQVGGWYGRRRAMQKPAARGKAAATAPALSPALSQLGVYLCSSSGNQIGLPETRVLFALGRRFGRVARAFLNLPAQFLIRPRRLRHEDTMPEDDKHLSDFFAERELVNPDRVTLRDRRTHRSQKG